MANPLIIHQLAGAYGLAPTAIAPPQRGYRNHSYALTLASGQQLNLIQYKRDPDITSRIRRANLAGEYAAQAGLPARTPTDPRILKIGGRSTTTYAGLYTYLPGNTIPWEAYTQRHLKLLGLAMAQVHRALTAIPQPNIIQDHSAATELQAQMRQNLTYFGQQHITTALHRKLRLAVDYDWLTRQSDIVAYTKHLPHQQALHLDFVRSNLLFNPAIPADALQLDGLALTGILDFEKTAWGHPLLDLARTLAFLLVDCQHKTPPQIRKYFLYSGYHKRGQAHIASVTRHHATKPLLEELADYYLFYDFSKFLRHNPYEWLPHNQHFRRTCQLLLNRKIIVAKNQLN